LFAVLTVLGHLANRGLPLPVVASSSRSRTDSAAVAATAAAEEEEVAATTFSNGLQNSSSSLDLERSSAISHQQQQTQQQETEQQSDQAGIDTCDRSVIKKVQTLTTMPRQDVNLFRRELVMSNYACYEQLRDKFAVYFVNRLPRKSQFILHVPKTGGTTLCRMAKRENKTRTTGHNCWPNVYPPYWCCWRPNATTTRQESVSCDQLKTMTDFIMNEDYLDDPMCMEDRSYTILLREPIKRVISQVNDLVTVGRVLLPWRMELVQSNYITWSLSASRYTYNEPKRNVTVTNGTVPTTSPALLPSPAKNAWEHKPTEDDLEYAKQTLLQFDFLLDVTDSNMTECSERIISFLGIRNNNMIAANQNPHDENVTEKYVPINNLDIQLYDFAMKLMVIDCDFFMNLGAGATVDL